MVKTEEITGFAAFDPWGDDKIYLSFGVPSGGSEDGLYQGVEQAFGWATQYGFSGEILRDLYTWRLGEHDDSDIWQDDRLGLYQDLQSVVNKPLCQVKIGSERRKSGQGNNIVVYNATFEYMDDGSRSDLHQAAAPDALILGIIDGASISTDPENFSEKDFIVDTDFARQNTSFANFPPTTRYHATIPERPTYHDEYTTLDTIPDAGTDTMIDTTRYEETTARALTMDEAATVAGWIDDLNPESNLPADARAVQYRVLDTETDSYLLHIDTIPAFGRGQFLRENELEPSVIWELDDANLDWTLPLFLRRLLDTTDMQYDLYLDTAAPEPTAEFLTGENQSYHFKFDAVPTDLHINWNDDAYTLPPAYTSFFLPEPDNAKLHLTHHGDQRGQLIQNRQPTLADTEEDTDTMAGPRIGYE